MFTGPREMLQDMAYDAQRARLAKGTRNNFETYKDAYLDFCNYVKQAPFPLVQEDLQLFSVYLLKLTA